MNGNSSLYSNNDERYLSLKKEAGGYSLTLEMPIYSLRSFEVSDEDDIVNVEVILDEENLKSIQEKANVFMQNMNPGQEIKYRLQRRIKESLNEMRYRDATLVLEHPVAWESVN